MVAEKAVQEFKVCLQPLKLEDERMKEQEGVLDKILEVKSANNIDELLALLETITESLMTLTINVTNTSREKLVKCEEEVANANSIIVRGGIGAPGTSQLSIGKELLSRVIGIGKFKESNFREWRHTLMISLHCMDNEIYDETIKFERTGK